MTIAIPIAIILFLKSDIDILIPFSFHVDIQSSIFIEHQEWDGIAQAILDSRIICIFVIFKVFFN
jgi:hypothetical protein